MFMVSPAKSTSTFCALAPPIGHFDAQGRQDRYRARKDRKLDAPAIGQGAGQA
jgi:hypothetical protein